MTRSCQPRARPSSTTRRRGGPCPHRRRRAPAGARRRRTGRRASFPSLPVPSPVELNPSDFLEQAPARIRAQRERAHPVEALQCVLGRDLRVLRDEGARPSCRDREHGDGGPRDPRTQTSCHRDDDRLSPGRAAAPRSRARPPSRRASDGVDHPVARTPAAGAGILEERDVAPRAALLVRVEEVVDGRVVLVHRLLHEPEPEDARVEVDVPRRVGSDARDVVDAVEPHRSPSASARPIGSRT